jgi:hypothetical protein
VLDGVGCVDLWRYVLGWLGVKGKVSAGAKVLLKTLPGKKKKENNYQKDPYSQLVQFIVLFFKEGDSPL